MDRRAEVGEGHPGEVRENTGDYVYHYEETRLTEGSEAPMKGGGGLKWRTRAFDYEAQTFVACTSTWAPSRSPDTVVTVIAAAVHRSYNSFHDSSKV